MPTQPGSWAPSGSASARMRLVLIWDVPTPTVGQTAVTVTGSVVLESGPNRFNDSSNSFDWSGSLLGTGSANNKSINIPGNSSQTLHTFSKSVPLTSSAQGMTVSFSLSGIEYVGASASVSATISIPAANKPATPGSFSATKASATSISVSWTGGLVQEIRARRRADKGSTTAAFQPWETVASGSGFASGTSFAVITGYEWEVAARRKSGDLWSDWSSASRVKVWTEPVRPAEVAMARSGSKARLTFAGGAVQKLEIALRSIRGSSTALFAPWQQVSGSSWSSGALIDVPMGYEVAARVRRESDGMASAWTESAGAARMFDKPGNTGALSVTRVNDARHDLTWSASPPIDAPILNFEVERIRSGEAYKGAVSPASANRTWSDMANLADDQVRWRIRAVNGAGKSDWVYSPYVWTTPAAPTGCKATRSDATSIDVEWTRKAKAATSQLLQGRSSTDGGSAWSSWADLAGHTGLDPSLSSRTVSGLAADRLWQVRPVARVTSPATLSGYGAASGTIQLLAQPNPPTPLGPTVTQSTQRTVTFQWRHNAVDGSKQTAAQVRYRVAPNASWTTLTVATATQATTSGLLPDGAGEWQVRSKGAHASYSDWSASASFEVAVPPSASILAPLDGAILTGNRLTLDVAFDDAQGAAMVGWTRRLRDSDGKVIEEKSGTGAPSQTVFTRILTNLSTYTAEWEVVSGTGLRSETASVHFDTNFLIPTAPLLTATWDEPAGLVHLLVSSEPSVTNAAPNPRFLPDLPIPAGAMLTDGWAVEGTHSLYVPPTLTSAGYGRVAYGVDHYGL